VEYEGLALELAHSPDRLAALRSHLAQSGRTGPLFDSGRYRQNFEQALLAIHRRHEAGLAPGHVFVKPGQVKAPV
jgi:predicted O-linked N-acetylglucosamine transferase (SPINDLY family)